MQDIIDQYNGVAVNSGGLIPLIEEYDNLEQMTAEQLVKEYLDKINQFKNNLDSNIVGQKIMNIDQIYQQIYQITQNVIILQKVNKSVGQVFPIYTQIARQYKDEGFGRKTIYEYYLDGNEMKYNSYDVPYLFKWNKYYYALLTDYKDNQKCENYIKNNIDKQGIYQQLIQGNVNSETGSSIMQNLDNRKVCSYPGQKYTKADDNEETQYRNNIVQENDDELIIIDDYESQQKLNLSDMYINNQNLFVDDQINIVNVTDKSQKIFQKNIDIIKQVSNDIDPIIYYSYNFIDVIPQHEHKDLVKNVLLINEGKNQDSVDITSQDFMNAMIYHRGETQYSLYPILGINGFGIDRDKQDFPMKLKNNINMLNDILSSDQASLVNYTQPAISVCWYVVIGYEL